MSLPTHGMEIVAGFFNAIEPWESGYNQHSFSYIAKKTNSGEFVISRGIIWLNSSESRVPFRYFETESICAEHFKLSDIGRSYKQCVHDLCDGMIVTPRGKRLFPSDPRGWHEAYFTPLHPSALQSQSRVNVLQIKGEEQRLASGPSLIDWELRGADTPYDTVQELLGDYNLGNLFADRIAVEIVASAIMGFDGDTSTIDGEKATIVVRLAKTLDFDNAAVGFREITPGRTNRGKLAGSQFNWRQTEIMQIGSIEMPVTRAAILHCYAMYKNVAQTHWFITDPKTSQNPRRVIFESFDTGIAILREFLGRTHGRGQDARDLEAATAWLFWMTGFNTVQLGSTGRTQDFADVILTTPTGQIAIVECTTGLLRADNKLPKLVARYALVRSKLDQSNNRHLKLLPIMVSTLSKDELQADLEQAGKLGVGVLTREDLDQLVERTIISSNADELFNLAEKNIEAAKYASIASEPELPLEQ